MGWRGTVRAIGAAARAAERDARRRQRELEREHQHNLKMLELDEASYEVEVYENYIDRITSVHKECAPEVDWQAIRDEPRPVEPLHKKDNESGARRKFETYRPGIFTKIFGSPEKEIAALESDIDSAIKEDAEQNKAATAAYLQELADWELQKELAERVFAKDPDAFSQALQDLGSFSEIEELGSELQFRITDDGVIFCTVKVHSKSIIPEQSKSLLKSGRLSEKNLPKGKFYALYQDYVCGVLLRLANEVFAILPIDHIVVTASDDMLNTRTGHMGEQPIVSAFIPRATLRSLNLDFIDPSDSLENFNHHMNFRKTQGFLPVTEVEPPQL